MTIAPPSDAPVGVVPNPFRPVEIIAKDREALYGGLISAGHPVEYARHQADTLPGTDGALQMLARHRIESLTQSQPDSGYVDTDSAGVERIKAALSPLVNEDMDEPMRDAWLTDLANAAAFASLTPTPLVEREITRPSGRPTFVPDTKGEELQQPSEAATRLALTATPDTFPCDIYGLAQWLDKALTSVTPPAVGGEHPLVRMTRALDASPAVGEGEVERLRAENADLRAQIDRFERPSSRTLTTTDPIVPLPGFKPQHLRGLALLFRSWCRAEMWGRPDEAELAARQVETAYHLLATLRPSPDHIGDANKMVSAPDAIREAIINTPETADFMAGVPIEATHQRERWSVDHDAGKSPFDWFWLIGYLAQKAADAATRGDTEKAMHHTISTAAALANWHAALSGASVAMRPGIGPDNGGDKPGSAHALAALATTPPPSPDAIREAFGYGFDAGHNGARGFGTPDWEHAFDIWQRREQIDAALATPNGRTNDKGEEN